MCVCVWDFYQHHDWCLWPSLCLENYQRCSNGFDAPWATNTEQVCAEGVLVSLATYLFLVSGCHCLFLLDKQQYILEAASMFVVRKMFITYLSWRRCCSRRRSGTGHMKRNGTVFFYCFMYSLFNWIQHLIVFNFFALFIMTWSRVTTHLKFKTSLKPGTH